MQKKITRHVGIDVFRHFLAIFVIIIHTWSGSRYSSDIHNDYSLLVDIVDGTVLGFFFVSGFFSKERDNLIDFTKDRFKRLIIPFLLFSVIYGILNIFVHGTTLIENLINILTLHGTSMQLYFLPYLFLTEIFFVSIFSKFKEHKKLLIVMFLTITILLTILLPTTNSTGPDYELLPYYAMGYLIGVLYSTYNKKIILLSVIGISFIIGILLDGRFLDISFILSIFLILLNFFKNSNMKIFGAGGVYLLHTSYLNFAISIILLKLGFQNWYNIFLTILITYISCIILTYIFIKYFPKNKYLLLE